MVSRGLSNRRLTAKCSRPPALFLAMSLLGYTHAVIADQPNFEKHVAPILAAKCLKCHGEARQQGGLDLRTRASMTRGGDSGPAVIAHDRDKSLLVQRILGKEMPPKEETPLTPDELAIISDWITAGAPASHEISSSVAAQREVVTPKDREHWSFTVLKQKSIPSVEGPPADSVRSPVDAFVLSRLLAAGLSFSPPAEKATLIRRATIDLLGLPPSAEELADFLADERPEAYELLIDRLLSSPHFGERWGRQWLDNVGYVDVIGTDNDATIISHGENKWMYRDYVIESLNFDKSFARFVTEQLAGDELTDWRSAPVFTDEMREHLIATGFLRVSSDDTQSPELNLPLIRHSVLQHTGEIVVSNLLALTFGCAKCHDHKYEPIPQADYYAFLAILQPAFNPDHWLQPNERQLPDVSPTEKSAIEKKNAELDEELKAPREQLAALHKTYEVKLMPAKFDILPEQIRADTKLAIETPPEKRTEVQKYLLEKFGPLLQVKPAEILAALNEADRRTHTELEKRIADLTGRKRSWKHWQVVYDVGSPTATHLLKRGSHESPGREVAPAGLTVLCSESAKAALPAVQPAGQSSGRRLALAKWLTDVNTPVGSLVLRVRVNRIWQQLFGRGIVETADNFGKTGSPPTHPELLDWLAMEFARNDQRLKPLLKLIMTSNVYRQSSVYADRQDAYLRDPDNRLLWRMPLRRLESEGIRDSLLSASGRLDTKLMGPPVHVEPRPDGTFVVPDKGLPTPSSRFRRSIYLLSRRNYHPTLLGVFDQPSVTSNCTSRNPSAVVLQSLTMLNDAFVSEQASGLADRITRDSQDQRVRVRQLFQIVLNRAPSEAEAGTCDEFLRRQREQYLDESIAADRVERLALEQLCHMVLNTSEFLCIP